MDSNHHPPQNRGAMLPIATTRNNLVEPEGFEPSSNGFKVHCSTY